MSTERNIRIAIEDALTATKAFDLVTREGLPEERGFAANKQRVAVIDPVDTTDNDLWDAQPDGGIEYACNIKLTLMFRHENPNERDDGVDVLRVKAFNALNGAVLIPGFTMPAKTRLRNWRWMKASHPERRITAIYTVTYLVDGWQSLDDSE